MINLLIAVGELLLLLGGFVVAAGVLMLVCGVKP